MSKLSKMYDSLKPATDENDSPVLQTRWDALQRAARDARHYILVTGKADGLPHVHALDAALAAEQQPTERFKCKCGKRTVYTGPKFQDGIQHDFAECRPGALDKAGYFHPSQQQPSEPSVTLDEAMEALRCLLDVADHASENGHGWRLGQHKARAILARYKGEA